MPAGLGQLAGSDPARSDELPGLLDRLRRLPDPRRLRGRRHPLSYVLALAACAVLAGAKSLTAIAEWAAAAPDRLLLHCGATLRDPDRPYRAPSEATVRRVLQRIDGDALDAAIGGWLTARADASRVADQDRHPPSRPVREAIAVDGKSLRGAIRADGRRVHLLSALRGDGMLAQREVDAKSNEITAFRPLLEALDLTGAVVTFDALLTQTDHAKFLVEEKDAHYIAVLKGNHPTLHRLVKDLPWKDVPLMDRTRATAHGRDDAPRAMASLRNLAIGALRLAGRDNIAEGLRHHGWDMARP